MDHNSFQDEIKKISETFLSNLYEKYPEYKIQDLKFISNLLSRLEIKYILQSRGYGKDSSFKESLSILDEEIEAFKRNFIWAMESFEE